MKLASAEVYVNLETEEIQSVFVKADSDLESEVIERIVVAPLREKQKSGILDRPRKLAF